MDKTFRKLDSIQLLRGLAALFVLFYHLIPIENKYFQFNLIPSFFSLGNIGVDMFFLISGFVLLITSRKYFNKGVLKFYYNRFSRVYPIYWFYTLLLLPVFIFFPEMVNSSQNGKVNLLYSFLLLPSEELPLLMVGWSLIYEVYFYLIFGVFLFLKRRHLPIILCVWLSIILISNHFFNLKNAFAEVYLNTLNIEFILGVILGLVYQSKSIQERKRYAVLLILVIGLILVLNFYGSYYSLGTFNRVIFYGLPSLLVILTFLLLELNYVSFKSIFTYLGDISYSLYLSHLLTLNLAALFISKLSFNNIFLHVFSIFGMILAVLLVAILSYEYIEKPLMNKFKKNYQ